MPESKKPEDLRVFLPAAPEFRGHVVATRMGERAYEAACSCGWLGKPDENWVVVSAAIVGHFNQHLLDS